MHIARPLLSAPVLGAAVLLLLGCGSESRNPTAVNVGLSLKDGVTRADSLEIGPLSRVPAALGASGQECLLTYSSPGNVLNCLEPVPALVPSSPWLQHGGGIFDSQRLPISIKFAGLVRGVTLESTGALKCSGASIGRIIGYRGGVEVVRADNVLIDQADCGADDVTFGVRGQVPASAAVDSLVIEGPDPWTFDVQGLNGRATLLYTITYDPSLSLDCAVVTRGQVTTCTILDSVDAVSGWRFDADFGLNDSVHVSTESTGLSWVGEAVMSGKVSAIVTVGGQLDTLSGFLTVSDRTGPAWRWDHGNDWTFRQDGPPLCAYTDFVVPGSSRLGVNRRTSGCYENVQQQLVSIEPSVASAVSRDSGVTAAGVSGGPNDGLWYVAEAHYYMDRTSEMNPFIRPMGPTDTLTNSTDRRVCRQPLNLGKDDPVVVNFFTYNSACRSFSLTPVFDAIWAHESLGTLPSNGHEGRRRAAARDAMNDPYRIAEPLVGASLADLRFIVAIAVNGADGRITDASDTGHSFVGNNYIVNGNCGQAWVFDTAQQFFVLFPMQIQRDDGSFTCI